MIFIRVSILQFGEEFFSKKNLMCIWVAAGVTMLHDTGISE